MGRVRLLLFAGALGVLANLIGCTPAAPSPTPAPGKPAAQAAVRAESPVSKPAEKPGPRADAAAAEWEQTVAGAKREGKVVVIGPVGSEMREGLNQGFQQKYPEIQIDYNGTRGAEMAARVLAEHGSAQYLTDILIAGTTDFISALIPANAVGDLRPYLVGPEANDLSRWTDGKVEFSDDTGKYNLMFAKYMSPPGTYNTTTVSPDDISSYKDLLAPKWKGKIVGRDPTLSGNFNSLVTYWYVTEGLGKDFIRQFFSQDVFILTDDRQILDRVARGDYALSFGANQTLAIELMQKGLPLAFIDGAAVKEGTYVTAGNGSVSVTAAVPHPNAAKVYINWLLSRDGQYGYSIGSGVPSVRLDVPRDHVLEAIIPKEGGNYLFTSKERYVLIKDEVSEFVKSLITVR